jgi:hypothetical protein
LLISGGDPDFEWLMTDAAFVRVHPHAVRCEGRQSGYGPHKRGLSTKIYLAADAHSMPVRAIITDAPAADSSKAVRLIEGMQTECLTAERWYDTDAIAETAWEPA